ncbi:unnamed protein product [Rotaria socialis]|uniref:peptide-O-fucosyltransferase n=2 Tax=Rotaria TaxID=231623 RepID=A0A820QSV2_9BILA|nr:unnamed protein product [Rotaria socialis]CAF3629724.1 unnamed protein product [Rotaria socialis]CAF4426535.1 unnamed protein product [Rotaria socialis]CAF4505835.1 unnamed protein product [Rotaria socialis]
MGLKDAIYLAAKSTRPIIISPWLYSRRMRPNSTSIMDWMKVPITRVYDVEYLITCLAQKNISALYPCHPDTCVSNFSPPRLKQTEIERGHNKTLPFVIANFNPIPIFETPNEHHRREEIDKCITWSCEAQKIGNSILNGIRMKSGKETFENVVGFHLRVEDDFNMHIANGRKKRNITSAKLLSFIPNEVVKCALDCYNATGAHMNVSGIWVYMASGARKNSPELGEFRKFFPRILAKEDFLLGRPPLGDDYLATIDSVVLEELSFFVGCWSSTFSIQVARNRRLKNSASALYTMDIPCQCHKYYTPIVV